MIAFLEKHTPGPWTGRFRKSCTTRNRMLEMELELWKCCAPGLHRLR